MNHYLGNSEYGNIPNLYKQHIFRSTYVVQCTYIQITDVAISFSHFSTLTEGSFFKHKCNEDVQRQFMSVYMIALFYFMKYE